MYVIVRFFECNRSILGVFFCMQAMTMMMMVVVVVTRMIIGLMLH